MTLLKKIRLTKTYSFNGRMSDLIEAFGSLKRPRIERINETSFKIRPFVSLGTLVVHGFIGSVDGINVTATLREIDEGKQLITFTTKLRPEHLLIGVIFPFIIVLSISKSRQVGEILFLFGLWIILHLWFHLIYRIQEKRVMKKVVEKLGLIENKEE